MAKNEIQSSQALEIELMQKRAEAEFALSPIGQALKQLEASQRYGQMLASTDIVPAAYRGNMANCAVAFDISLRMGMTPLAVMQNLYIVNGNPAWSSKFLIACIAASRRFTTLEYEMRSDVPKDSDEYGCRCTAYSIHDKERKNPLHGTWVTWKMVKEEGWLDKRGSKWRTMPEQMFCYRAAAFWQRLYAPEIGLGMGTVEEAYDIAPTPNEVQDVTFTEVEEAQAPQIEAEQIEAAFTALRAAASQADVRKVRKDHTPVYNGNESFRDAVIEAYESFETAEPEPQAPQQ